jgi:high mobility group protein B2
MSSKKPDRDPNAPKRNLSAYLLYQNAMRDQFKAVNPGMTFGQLAKYTSAMYAQLPPHEKEAWSARAEADKGRYLHELSTYVPPPGFDSKGDAIVSAPMMMMQPGIKPKPQKDANAPKRNISAYLLYQNAMREQFKRDNPGMTFGQLAKYTSHMYKNLTPQEKATWEYRSQQDKARYDAEIAGYVPPPGHDSRGVSIEDHNPRKRTKRGTKEPGAPKRASGAYVFFTNDMRPRVLSEYPGIKFIELGRVLGERWRALTPHQKKRYEDIANQDKARFQMEMQQYKATGQHLAHHVPAQPYHHYAPPVVQEYSQPPPPKKARTKKSEPKDPGAPKRASGAYVFFTNEMRPRILQEYPGIKESTTSTSEKAL